MAKEQFKTIHSNDFQTPDWLFNSLNEEFNFQWDLACTAFNQKSPNGLRFEEVDSLTVDWHKLSDGWLWLNPPYSPLKPWIEKAQAESRKGAKIVVLCPPLISSRYFSKIPPAQIRFILGRISFLLNGEEMKGNTTDSCLLVYGPPVKTDLVYVDRESFRKAK